MNDSWQIVIQAIGSLGFPIVISIYLLTTFRKTIENLTSMISNLKDAIDKLCAKDIPNG